MTGEEIEIKKENQVTEKAATGIKNYVQEEKETVGEIEIITGILEIGQETEKHLNVVAEMKEGEADQEVETEIVEKDAEAGIEIMKEIKDQGEKDHDPEKRDEVVQEIEGVAGPENEEADQEIVQRMVLKEINQENVIEKRPITKKSKDLVDHQVEVEIKRDQTRVHYLPSRVYKTDHAQIVEIMKALIIKVYLMIMKAINTLKSMIVKKNIDTKVKALILI